VAVTKLSVLLAHETNQGVCNFGKLNYFLGKHANDEGRESRYPNINFCEQPNSICDSEEHTELKWIAGMFYWVESLQSYSKEGWDYISELKKFVDNGRSPLTADLGKEQCQWMDALWQLRSQTWQ
jgi:hypothetical protein